MSKGYVYILTNPSLREVSCGEREVSVRPSVRVISRCRISPFHFLRLPTMHIQLTLEDEEKFC